MHGGGKSDQVRAGADAGYVLEPGHIYFTREIDIIRAVAGSSVCVAVWDKKLGYGGMNNYIRAASPGRQSTAEFGDAATVHLLRMFRDSGSEFQDLKAQIIGGAVPEGKAESHSEDRIKIARNVLKSRGVDVISEDVGGNLGRKILFDTSTGEVAILKVFRLRSEDWYD